jgi:hypothetical protein
MGGQVFNIMNGMLWLVALYLVVVNYQGFTSAIGAASTSWRATLKTLQGR